MLPDDFDVTPSSFPVEALAFAAEWVEAIPGPGPGQWTLEVDTGEAGELIALTMPRSSSPNYLATALGGGVVLEDGCGEALGTFTTLQEALMIIWPMPAELVMRLEALAAIAHHATEGDSFGLAH
jgi:hypothetical protein